MLQFTAFGIPQPQGSARAFVVKGRAIVTSDNPKNKGWRQLVAEAASVALLASRQQCSLSEVTMMDDAPVVLVVAFYLPRPKALAKKDAPMTKRPDVDKLARSVKDALTGVVWHDDSQVTDLHVTKQYAERDGGVPRAEVTVRRV